LREYHRKADAIRLMPPSGIRRVSRPCAWPCVTSQTRRVRCLQLGSKPVGGSCRTEAASTGRDGAGHAPELRYTVRETRSARSRDSDNEVYLSDRVKFLGIDSQGSPGLVVARIYTRRDPRWRFQCFLRERREGTTLGSTRRDMGVCNRGVQR